MTHLSSLAFPTLPSCPHVTRTAHDDSVAPHLARELQAQLDLPNVHKGPCSSVMSQVCLFFQCVFGFRCFASSPKIVPDVLRGALSPAGINPQTRLQMEFFISQEAADWWFAQYHSFTSEDLSSWTPTSVHRTGPGQTNVP